MLWYYTPMALPWSEHLDRSLTVFDCMDHLAGFRGAPAGLLELEARLFEQADMVLTGGAQLYAAKRESHPNVHCFPSSVDVAHFGTARHGLIDPPDQAAIPHPRFGYCGVIDERMDIELVAATAAARPDWQFVMLGPVVKIDPAELPRAVNIHYLGMKRYEELPAYLGGWDVGMMPFAHNEATRFISPTKTPEYLAAGLRVVSTGIHDVVEPYGHRGLAQIGDGAAGFLEACRRALATDIVEHRNTADRLLAEMSWDRTWAAIDELMSAALARRSHVRSATAAASTVPAVPSIPAAVVTAGGSRARRRPVVPGTRSGLQRAPARSAPPKPAPLVPSGSPSPMLPQPASGATGSLASSNSDGPRRRRRRCRLRRQRHGRAIRARARQARPPCSIAGRTSVATPMTSPTRPGSSSIATVPTSSTLHRSLPAHAGRRLHRDVRADARPPRIEVRTGTDFHEVADTLDYGTLIYTGPVDAFFGHRFGRLPYRSLRFEFETLPVATYQPTGTVNYPDETAVPYTRISEFKHITGQEHDATTIVREFPQATGDPYYPIPRPENAELYARYRALAEATPTSTSSGGWRRTSTTTWTRSSPRPCPRSARSRTRRPGRHERAGTAGGLGGRRTIAPDRRGGAPRPTGRDWPRGPAGRPRPARRARRVRRALPGPRGAGAAARRRTGTGRRPGSAACGRSASSRSSAFSTMAGVPTASIPSTRTIRRGSRPTPSRSPGALPTFARSCRSTSH